MTTPASLIHSPSSLLTTVNIVVRDAVKLFADENGWEGRSGGYFCLTDGKTGLPDLIARIGTVPLERAEKYFRFSQEKPVRLSRMAKERGHISSWQSRNPELNLWGGAVLIGEEIPSFSGFPELGDEAIVLVSSVLHAGSGIMRVDTELIARKIVDISGNPYFLRLLDFCER